MPRVVTIDGPAGAGKSTAARGLAARLGWSLLDTGAMYRAVALAALRAGLDLSCDEALGELASRCSVTLTDGRVVLNGEDVSTLVRSAEVTRATSPVADKPAVRLELVRWQREYADGNDVVTEGRDQGTVVFPDALCKFFLTADASARAGRRLAEFAARGVSTTASAVLSDIEARDAHDASRAVAPMAPAPDALVVDSSGMTPDAVVDLLASEVSRRLATGTTP